MNDTNSKQPQDHAPTLSAIQSAIAEARKMILADAERIVEEFKERRKEISEGFSNLNVLVRNRQDGRSIAIIWVLFHFRNGYRTGQTNLKKKRGSHYDIAVIRLAAPSWLEPLAVDTELALRPLRDALDRLTNMERDLRVIDARLCSRIALKPMAALESGNETEEVGFDFDLAMKLWEDTAPLEPEDWA